MAARTGRFVVQAPYPSDNPGGNRMMVTMRMMMTISYENQKLFNCQCTKHRYLRIATEFLLNKGHLQRPSEDTVISKDKDWVQTPLPTCGGQLQ